MCPFCKGKKISGAYKGSGYESSIHLEKNLLCVSLEVQENVEGFYDYFQEGSFTVKYCPMCGKKLEAE